MGASIQVRTSGKPHHYLTAESQTPRAARVTISRWQLGLVAAHQPCCKCSVPLLEIETDREHAVAHVEVRDRVEALVKPLPVASRYGHTPLDAVINAGADTGWDPGMVALMVEVITDIELVCRGRVRTSQGFFVPQGRGPVDNIG